MGCGNSLELVAFGGTSVAPFRTRPNRWMATVLHRGAMHRETIRELHWKASDLDRRCLGRGFCGRTTRRWDEPLQNVWESGTSWQEQALDKVASRSRLAPPGLFTIGATPD